MDPAWLEAARRYLGLSETERASYWASLDSGQRATLERAVSELQSARTQSSPPAPTAASRGCGCGCGRFFGRGCLIIVVAFALLTIWSNLPWRTGPSTDRFALWPDNTRDAMASNAPIEPLLLKTEKTQYVEEAFFPIEELRRWLAITHLETSDVSAISLLNTVQDGGGWWFKDGKFDYDEITSAIAVLELSTSAPNILGDLPVAKGSLESIAGKQAFAFDNPFEGLEKRGRNVGPAIEKWYLAALNDRVLLIGGRTAVEQVLKTAAGERDGITTRHVLGPLLKVIEPAPELHAHFVPPTKERSIPVVSTVMVLLSHLPVLVACKGSFGTSNAVLDVDVAPTNGPGLVVVSSDVGHQFAA